MLHISHIYSFGSTFVSTQHKELVKEIIAERDNRYKHKKNIRFLSLP